jgi:hypothetical protein
MIFYNKMAAFAFKAESRPYEPWEPKLRKGWGLSPFSGKISRKEEQSPAFFGNKKPGQARVF